MGDVRILQGHINDTFTVSYCVVYVRLRGPSALVLLSAHMFDSMGSSLPFGPLPTVGRVFDNFVDVPPLFRQIFCEPCLI